MHHVAIPLVVHSCASAIARLRSCIVVRVTPENQADQAVASLRRCLKLLPWLPRRTPAKAVSSRLDRPRPNALTPAAVATAFGCLSAQTRTY